LFAVTDDFGAGPDGQPGQPSAGLDQEAVHRGHTAGDGQRIQPLDSGHQALQETPPMSGARILPTGLIADEDQRRDAASFSAWRGCFATSLAACSGRRRAASITRGRMIRPSAGRAAPARPLRPAQITTPARAITPTL